MELTKENIRVTIDSKEKKQRAFEILKKHGESIWDNISGNDYIGFGFNHLKYYYSDSVWFIGSFVSNLTEITLDQLDELLTELKQLEP